MIVQEDQGGVASWYGGFVNLVRHSTYVLSEA